MRSKYDNADLGSKDLHMTKAIDTYVRAGEEHNILAIKPGQRKAFFTKQSEAHTLLLREEQNPLLEEGSLGDGMRDRSGELYLTYEAITLLIEKKIRHPKKSASGLSYATKNLFVLKNDVQQLKAVLLNLDLMHGEDAKIIYISRIHAVPFYLRNEEGQIKCFIVDSESGVYGNPDELIDTIKSVFPGTKIFLSTTTLQKDFYSCSTFAFKATMYFAKHGAEVFPWLEKNSTEEDGLHLLPPDRLMPRLLKMSQSKLNLSSDLLDSIVSHKPKSTLREYYARSAVITNGKSFNSSALLKKYKYLFELNDYIVSNQGEEKINIDCEIKMPIALEGRHQFYSRVPKLISRPMKSNPVDVYLGIIELCDNPTDAKPDKNSIAVLEVINKRFPSFQSEYQQRFKKGKSTEKDTTQKLFFVAACAEIKDFEHVKEYLKFSDKLLKLFSTYAGVLSYLRKYATFDTRQPVHDICLFAEPRSSQWEKNYWAQLVMDYGQQATRFLALAPQIEKLLKSPNANFGSVKPSNELDKIHYLLENFNYPHGSEHKELTELCRKHVVSEKDFEHCLDIINSKLKAFDVLPDITIAGSVLGPKFKNYRFIKLPITDLRGLFLGEYSACCQSLGKAGQACAIHGMTSPMSAFYVVLDDKDQITAQAWAWVGKQGEFVFDSWEFSNSNKANLFKPFITKAAELIIKYGYSRVLVGTGGRTPKVGFKETENPAKHKDECSYSDAHSQYLIQSAPAVALQTKFPIYADRISMNSGQYDSVFESSVPEEIQSKLFQLIQQRKLPFNDFVALVRFSYINRIDFLHHQSNEGLLFLLSAFQKYGNKMECFFYLKDQANIFLLEAMIKYDSTDLMMLVLNFLKQSKNSVLLSAGKERIERMPHIAARNNAGQVFQFLYATYYSDLSWEEYVSLPNSSGMSSLYVAAQNKHPQFVDDCAKPFHSKKALFKVVNQTPQSHDCTVFHYLAGANALVQLKKMLHYFGEQSFCKLLDNTAEFTVNDCRAKQSPLFFALLSGALDVADYLLSNFYSKEVQKTILKVKFDDLSILGYAAKTNNLELMKLVHQLQESEDEWFELLSMTQGYDRRCHVLYLAMDSKSWQCALYIINSLKSFDHLQELLSTSTSSQANSPLELIESASVSKEVSRIVRRIMKLYSLHLDKLKIIILRDYHHFIRGIIHQQDIRLFDKFLKFIGGDQALFNQLLDDQDHEETLLNSIVKAFDKRTPWRSGVIVPFTIKKQFIDCLLRHCSADQVKVLLNSTSYIRELTADTLSYLLSIIDRIDNGEFRNQWLTLDSDGPLHIALHHQLNSDSVTQVMLDYAVIHCGKKAVQDSLLSNNKMMFYPIVSFKNDVLLHFIYPLISTDQEKVVQLLNEMMDEFRQSSFELNSFIWLLDQPEITVAMLTDCISVEKRRSVFTCSHRDSYSLECVLILWKACAKKMNTEEQIGIIYANFFDVLTLLLRRCEYKDKKSEQRVHEFKLHLHSWLEILKKQDKLLFVLTTKSADGKAIFDYPCEANHWDVVKIMLQHCDKEQRRQLAESYLNTGIEDDRKKKALKLTQLITQCNRIDLLLELKAEINGQPLRGPSLFFHSVAPDLASFRIMLWEINSENCLFMEREKIDQIWEQVQQALKAVEVKPECSNNDFVLNQLPMQI